VPQFYPCMPNEHADSELRDRLNVPRNSFQTSERRTAVHSYWDSQAYYAYSDAELSRFDDTPLRQISIENTWILVKVAEHQAVEAMPRSAEILYRYMKQVLTVKDVHQTRRQMEFPSPPTLECCPYTCRQYFLLPACSYYYRPLAAESQGNNLANKPVSTCYHPIPAITGWLTPGAGTNSTSIDIFISALIHFVTTKRKFCNRSRNLTRYVKLMGVPD
jgi:hypothetical protein